MNKIGDETFLCDASLTLQLYFILTVLFSLSIYRTQNLSSLNILLFIMRNPRKTLCCSESHAGIPDSRPQFTWCCTSSRKKSSSFETSQAVKCKLQRQMLMVAVWETWLWRDRGKGQTNRWEYTYIYGKSRKGIQWVSKYWVSDWGLFLFGQISKINLHCILIPSIFSNLNPNVMTVT